MKRITITLRSGATVQFDGEVTTEVAPLTGTLRTLKWTHDDRAVKRLLHVDIDDIAAISYVAHEHEEKTA